MPMRDVKFCETCAISSPNLSAKTGRICNKWQAEVKDSDFCSYYTKELWKCDCCGGKFWTEPILSMLQNPSTGAIKIEAALCMHCFMNLKKCITCKFGKTCAFESDPSQLPKIIQKQVRQGNMTAVTQVMNPERIAITCQKGCHCWSPDSSCLKQNHGTCQQYQMNLV